MLPKKISSVIKNGYNKCFGCAPDNPIGLKLNFSWDGKAARASFIPGEFHQGWSNIMHGGIIYSLLDEAMAYATFYHGINGVTARTQVRFKSPIPIGEPLSIVGMVTKETRRLVETSGVVVRQDGSVGAESNAVIYIVDRIQPNELPKSSRGASY